MKYIEVMMKWDTFTFPVKKGTPVNIHGLLANDASAVGIIPEDISVCPVTAGTRVQIGGSADLDAMQASYGSEYDSNALTAMDGITFLKGGTRYPNIYKKDYVLPAATASKLGGVKQASNVAASEATDVAGCVTSINAILTALKTAGIMVADAEE